MNQLLMFNAQSRNLVRMAEAFDMLSVSVSK